MKEEAERNVQKNWNFVFDRLFLSKTGLVYDYVTSSEKDGATRHIATAEEVRAGYPNVCGWFSGMENTDLCGGMMLEAVLCRYDVTGDPAMKKYAEELYAGLMANATVSKEKGFLARGRHPSDGVTHYINSSRDQYTHWISAMLRYYRSGLCDDEKRERIKSVLVEMAEKAERDVVPENNYCLLNEEGRPALVCEMHVLGDNIMWHEALRLAAFYMAAYAVTRDEHWLAQYRKNRDWGLDFSEKINLDIFKAAFALVQMQMSIKVLRDNEKDAAYAERYAKLMERLARFAECFLPRAREQLKGVTVPDKLISWRDCPEEFTSVTTKYGYRSIFFDVHNATSFGYYLPLRNVPESMIIMLLCDDYKISAEKLADFEDFFASDYPSHCADSMPSADFCLAFWLLKSRIKDGTI